MRWGKEVSEWADVVIDIVPSCKQQILSLSSAVRIMFFIPRGTRREEKKGGGVETVTVFFSLSLRGSLKSSATIFLFLS